MSRLLYRTKPLQSLITLGFLSPSNTASGSQFLINKTLTNNHFNMRAPPSNAILPAGSLVLITGANGYLGGKVAEQLLEISYRMRVSISFPNYFQKSPPLQHCS